MITRALDVKERIERFCKGWLKDTPSEKALKLNKMKPQHWKQLDRIHDALSTFEVATMDSQGNQRYLYDWFPTLSFMLNIIDDFKTEFAAEAAEDASFKYISECCDHAWHKIEKYYKLCDNMPIVYAAVYLNPTLKSHWFESQWTQESQSSWASTVRQQVVDIWTTYKDTSVPAAPAAPAAPSEDSVHDRLREFKRLKTTHIATAALDELDDYLSSDPLPDPQYASGQYNAKVAPFDCLTWWMSRRQQWPNLSRMALDCLALPLMSDNPERSFSAGRDMITYRRSQLAGDIIEACAFLRSAYGPPVKVKAGVTVPAFDDESDIEKDIASPVTASFCSTLGLTESQATEVDEDLYGASP